MQDLKFRLMLDLISTVGARASQEGRQFEDAQRRMSDSTDRTASRFERLSRLTAGWGNDSSTERQVRWMEKLGQAVDQAHNKFQGLKRSLSAGLDKLPEIGMAVGAGAYAAKRVGLPPLQAFASLEEAVTELRMAMLRRDGTVGSGFDAISRAAIELGAKLPGTTKDFMSSAVALKQQGMPDEAILKGGLRAAGGFGVLMNMNQGEAATAIAKMREAYGVPDSQLYGMADLMQRGRYAFGIDPSDFKAVATYAAPTFNQLGLRGLGTAKELLAVQGMAASVGLEASSFGTNFADMLRRLSQVTGRQNRNSEQAREVRRTLKEAGVLIALDGLHTPSMGARVSFPRGKPIVTDGPFTEAKEVLGGYWMIDVKSREEAIAWASKCPASENEIIEIRQVQEMSDFPDEVQQAAEGFAELQKGNAHRAG